MKRGIRFCCAALACILGLALLPAAKTAAIDIDPEWVGVWYGNIGGDWGQINMKADGTWESLVYSNASLSSSGTYFAKNGTASSTDVKFGNSTSTYTIEGDALHWRIGGAVREFRRMAGPLVRVPLPETMAAASADPAIAGIWGGIENGDYSEWSFSSGGIYEKITPARELTVYGIYAASGGTLVILLENEAIRGMYTAGGSANMQFEFGGGPVPAKRISGGRLVPAGRADTTGEGDKH